MDDNIRDIDDEVLDPNLEEDIVDGKKKKDLLDPDTDSLDDLAEEEEDDVEPMDDVEVM